MLEEVEFLFDARLVSEISRLIQNAEKSLLLVSPFFDLDARTRTELAEKKSRPNFELKILFGKNDDDLLKSMKADTLRFFMDFPNVEIRYNSRLHAKYFQSDYEYIATSLNLSNYSIANNIEFGVKCQFANKGLIGKMGDVAAESLAKGVDHIKKEVFEVVNKHDNPRVKFEQIFNSSVLKFKTRPLLAKSSGIGGIFGAKKVQGFEVIHDEISMLLHENRTGSLMNAKINRVINPADITRYTSATDMSRSFQVDSAHIVRFMENKGLILDGVITEKGASKGLELREYKGKPFIAYPKTLPEIEELRASV